MPTLSPSPFASLSPPSVGECLARCTAPAVLPSPPLPPPRHMPPPVDRRDDIPKTEMSPRKRLCLSTLGSKYEVRGSSIARPTEGRGINYGFVSTLDAEARRRGIGEVGYGIRDTWVDPGEAFLEIAHMTVGEVNTKVTELAELHEHNTQDLYALLEDTQDSRTRISQRVAVDSEREASKPKTLDETIELANDVMDQKLHTYAERSSGNANVTNAQRKNGANSKGNSCFEYGASPKLKNKDGEKVNAPGWVYAVGNAKKRGNKSRDPDSNVFTGTFLLNNYYASILFDIGADRSFISTVLNSPIDIVPTQLGNSYDVKLADGKIVRVDTIM
nr:reverse transcriptase domain-containing protein [Tanacetum cinerariifolium]